MKKFYYVATIQENKKYYSYVLPVKENNNLLSIFKIKNVIDITPYATKKQAQYIANFYNVQYKIDGCFLFEGGAF